MSGDNNHRRENTLLRLCARPDVTAELVDTADQLLAAEIDWTYLIRAAFQHQLIPLVDRILQQLGVPEVPGDILQALRYRIDKNRERNEYLADQWFTLIRSFASAGMQTPILIQGSPTTARVYGEQLMLPPAQRSLLRPKRAKKSRRTYPETTAALTERR